MTGRSPFALDGRVALVTGAARGLGWEIAAALAAAGAQVYLNGRDAERLAGPVEELRSHGLAAMSAPFDVADDAAVAAGIEAIEAEAGRLDILVSNVGMRHRAPLADLAPVDVRRMLDVNLAASFVLAQAAAPGMRMRGFGRLILITSIAGPRGKANDAAYVAAKGGLEALTRALAVELGPHGITANAISPGFFATEANEEMVADPGTAELLARRCPLGRWGRPEEIGGAAVFLASDAASYVNGHVLTVDGGMSASF
ncbi:MAG TPA: SDR family oxidoreductase [Aliidongia sp.]|nr:SDR family oxidoreductase [Aliidongia sp.]